MHTIIRPIQPRDFAAATALLTATLADGLEPSARTDALRVATEYLEDSEDMVAVTLVALVGDILCGIAQLSRDGELRLFHVPPEWQRRSIGRALLVEMVINAQSLGLGTLQINCPPAAHAFFAAHGFSARNAEFSDWLIADLSLWNIQYDHITAH